MVLVRASGGALAKVAGSRALAAGVTGASISPLLFGGDGDGVTIEGEVIRKRRRRRRALTASDRADIGFITGLLGVAAGKSFALVIGSRTT